MEIYTLMTTQIKIFRIYAPRDEWDQTKDKFFDKHLKKLNETKIDIKQFC